MKEKIGTEVENEDKRRNHLRKAGGVEEENEVEKQNQKIMIKIENT